jgi:hypothetical protein
MAYSNYKTSLNDETIDEEVGPPIVEEEKTNIFKSQIIEWKDILSTTRTTEATTSMTFHDNDSFSVASGYNRYSNRDISFLIDASKRHISSLRRGSFVTQTSSTNPMIYQY